MPIFRLAAVLRARRAQEDVAKAEVARARGDARAASDTTADRDLALRATDLPTGVSARAVTAALAARRSLAEGLAAARHGETLTKAQVDARMAALVEAAKRRRVVEKLAERHAAQWRASEEAAEQAALDEIAVTAAARKGFGR
jgi:flagellar export protein FliJ